MFNKEFLCFDYIFPELDKYKFIKICLTYVWPHERFLIKDL